MKLKIFCIFCIFLPFWLILAAVGCQSAPAPLGVIGAVDSLGFNNIQWVCPEVNDTTYRAAANTRLKGMYISRQPGAHQIACRFGLSPVRQLVDFADIWVEKGRDYSQQEWLTKAAIRFGLLRDSTGSPGQAASHVVEYYPGSAGIPPEGGYMRVEFAEPVSTLPGDTLWLLIEWPPEFPDLVWIGVDTEPATFNSRYRLGGQGETQWQIWTLHNFMVQLHSLRYSNDCGDPTGLAKQAADCPAVVREFQVARRELFGGMIGDENPVFTVLPGTQTCFHDSAVFVDRTYDYEIQSICDADTSAPGSVSVAVTSPLSCDWTTPQPDVYLNDQDITLAHIVENLGPAPLTATFTARWMISAEYNKSVTNQQVTADSIPLFAAPSSALIAAGDMAVFDLSPEYGQLDAGLYETNCIFSVSAFSGAQAKYWFKGAIEVLISTGIPTDNEDESLSISDGRLRLFPNPGSGDITIEFTPPRYEQQGHSTGWGVYGNVENRCRIQVYDLLGRKVADVSPIPTDSGREHYRVVFPGNDKYGNQLPTGLYFVKVEVGEWSICRKLIVIH